MSLVFELAVLYVNDQQSALVAEVSESRDLSIMLSLVKHIGVVSGPLVLMGGVLEWT